MSLQNPDERPALLRMTGIDKSFPGVHALKGVDLEVRLGEVHALVGENGAGKSTLMHILAGVYQPDAGSIAFDGREHVRFADERDAQLAGVGIVYQERSLIPTLTVAENVFAARQPVKSYGMVDWKRLQQDTAGILSTLRLNIKPTDPVESLEPVAQQMVEIAKAISMKAKLLIFDEPTAALSEDEKNILFDVIRTLKSQVGIIYISHRLEEIFQICDRVTVLKDGEKRGTLDVRDATRDRLITLMVGREKLSDRERASLARADAPPILEARNVSDGRRVRNVSFAVRPGEVIAFAGLAGAGRTELALAIFGASKRTSGELLLNGQTVEINSPSDAIAHGIGYVPEDRRSAGLFLEMAIHQNIASAQLNRFGRFFLKNRAMIDVAKEYRQKLAIATPDVLRPAQNLSGGNQQKVVIARWLLVNPKVLIADEPTRGVDVGAKSEVHRLLRDLAATGAAVIVISSELPEVLAVADRILVMCDGRISGELDGRTATEEQILHFASLFNAN